MCQTQATASDLPMYNIFVLQKVSLSKISDDVIYAPPIKQPGFAHGDECGCILKYCHITIQAIRNNDFLKYLTSEQIHDMIECVQRVMHQSGVFIKEGTRGDCLYILESGVLEVSQVRLLF